jgi:hypothetical protein
MIARNAQRILKYIHDGERHIRNTIRQITKETRQLLFKYTCGYINYIDIKLNKLRNRLQENDFKRSNLSSRKERFSEFVEELAKTSNITIPTNPMLFVSNVYRYSII